MKEREPAFFIGASLGLLAISLLSFSHAIKKQVREEQDGQCAKCAHKPKKLQVHHRVPEAMGGAGNRQNAVGLCPPDHKYFDKLAVEQHIIYPNIPLSQAPDNLFKKHLRYKPK